MQGPSVPQRVTLASLGERLGRRSKTCGAGTTLPDQEGGLAVRFIPSRPSFPSDPRNDVRDHSTEEAPSAHASCVRPLPFASSSCCKRKSAVALDDTPLPRRFAAPRASTSFVEPTSSNLPLAVRHRLQGRLVEFLSDGNHRRRSDPKDHILYERQGSTPRSRFFCSFPLWSYLRAVSESL